MHSVDPPAEAEFYPDSNIGMCGSGFFSRGQFRWLRHPSSRVRSLSLLSSCLAQLYVFLSSWHPTSIYSSHFLQSASGSVHLDVSFSPCLSSSLTVYPTLPIPLLFSSRLFSLDPHISTFWLSLFLCLCLLSSTLIFHFLNIFLEMSLSDLFFSFSSSLSLFLCLFICPFLFPSLVLSVPFGFSPTVLSRVVLLKALFMSFSTSLSSTDLSGTIPFSL